MHRGAVIAVVFAVLAIAAAPVRADSKRKKAREHFNQGEMYMQAAVYDLAIEEYRRAYVLVPSAHGFLFNIGLAYQKWGKLEQALAEFKQYLKKQPKGDKVPETRARIISIERTLAERGGGTSAGKPPDRGTTTTDPDPPPDDSGGPDRGDTDAGDPTVPPPGAGAIGSGPEGDGGTPLGPGPGSRDRDRPEASSGGVQWGWVAVGAGLASAGLLMDLGLDSSNNGTVEAMDFVPLALYGAGAFFVIRGVF